MWLITHNTKYDLDSMAVPFEGHDLTQYFGFVYLIIDKVSGKKYIGKKLLWSSKILPVTKTRKRRKKTLVESDWMSYYGSSKALQDAVALHGAENFKRVILRLCKSKGECSYYETKLQFQYDVLLDPTFYNDFVGCRIHSKHLKDMTNAKQPISIR
jgi:hypothetical protein